MQDKIYLLSLEELLGEDPEKGKMLRQSDELSAKAAAMLDRERLKKLEHIKSNQKQIESMGAGLLLQFAVKEALAETDKLTVSKTQIMWMTFSQLVDKLDKSQEPLSLEYTYGEQGKPYLKNYPYYFNISHSGKLVLCVLSEQEVGADIQLKSSRVNERILQRFFSTEEKAYWEQCGTETEKRDFFYRMWCRKEAYGKLTGEGIKDALGENMHLVEERNNQLIDSPNGLRTCVGYDKNTQSSFEIREYEEVDDYQIAICKWK